jgi:hypothetical protein
MTMNRQTPPALLRTAIAAALFASLALVGCKKKTETAVTPPPASEPAATTPAPAATTSAPAPAATALTVTTVDLGNAVGADNKVSMPMTTFAKGDTIHASVATDGPGGQLTAKWTMGGTPVSSQDKTVPAGPQVTEFSINKPDGWPVGHYKLDVLVDGNVVQSREYDVK